VNTPADNRLTKIETTLWGAYGTNGLNSEVKRHGEQIGELFGRDEAMRQHVDQRLKEISDVMHTKLDRIYAMLMTVIASILLGAAGIIATVVLTK
jgi:hypothetical protein